MSQVRWAMIISMTSSGSLVAGDGGVIEVFGEGRPERAPRILVRPLYQTRIASNLITVANSNQVVRASSKVNQNYLIMRMSESSSTALWLSFQEIGGRNAPLAPHPQTTKHG